jgi:uncharacterized surface protein with fasciclin (FAS1) repeats
MYAKFAGRRWLCATSVAVLALAGWSAAAFAQENKPEPPRPKDIVDVAREAPNLKTFCMLVEKAGLVDMLREKGPFTVLAPTDEAFNKLGKEKLEELQKEDSKATLQRMLKNHVIPGRRLATELEQAKSVRTLAGGHLKIAMTEGTLTIDKAKVVKSNIETGNGVLYTIDAVLMPQERPASEERPRPQQ